VIEIPGKHSLRPDHVAVIQHSLCPGFRWFGMIIEPVALLATISSMILLWNDGAAF
jgi:hypothetical protein